MPQPTTQNAPAATPEPTYLDKLNAKVAAMVKAGKKPDEIKAELTSPERQILRAVELEAERSGIMEKVGKNREFLRLMDKNEELSDEQSAYIKMFYPEKEKGAVRSADEIEATRKARAAARK